MKEIEMKKMAAYERLIAIYQGQKYKGMYKNILEANRRSSYTNKNKKKLSRNPSVEPWHSPKKALKIKPLMSPMEKIQMTRSTRRILDDLSDPLDPKNVHFAKLEEQNRF